MNVVVSAIVNPWVTTLSFVVALAMRIQEANFTDSLQKSGARWARGGRAAVASKHTQARGGRVPRVWRETPSTPSAFAQENPVPTRSEYRAESTYGPRRVTRCRLRLPELQR